MNFDFFKIEVFIPEDFVNNLRIALNEIGALTVGGNYDNCMAISEVTGSWRPLNGANPFNGNIGEICFAKEYKVEFCCKEIFLKKTISTIKKVHPYEVPVINIIPILDSFNI